MVLQWKRLHLRADERQLLAKGGMLSMKRTYLHFALTLFLATMIAVLATGTGGAASQQFAQVRFDGWGYTLVAPADGSGVTEAFVKYDAATATDLQRYAATNRVLAQQLAAKRQPELAASVSFRRPLSVDEFRAWAARVPLRIESFQLRLMGSEGQRWTLGGTPSQGNLIATDDLQRNLTHLATKGVTDLRGVITVEGRIKVTAYDRLANDPAVFLADVTRSAVASHVSETVPAVDANRLTVLVSPAFWRMEELGLENFR